MKADAIVEKLIDKLTDETFERARVQAESDALRSTCATLRAEVAKLRDELSALKLARAA